MQKIRINDYKQLKQYQCTMQETSKDTSKNPVQFMTLCSYKVVNFDRVKTNYLNELGLSEENAHSVDALWENNDEIYMIEFKNGKIENRNIEQKARDSVLIFNSITKQQIDYTRKYMSFILVYNEKENNIGFRERKALAIAEKGKVDYTMWGLGKLRGFCYHRVYAMDRERFEEFLEKHKGE